MTFSAGMYILNHEQVTRFFTHLGFPLWMILALLSQRSQFFKEWAYAGFTFDLLGFSLRSGWRAMVPPPCAVGNRARLFFGRPRRKAAPECGVGPAAPGSTDNAPRN